MTESFIMFVAEFLKIPNDFLNQLIKSTIALFVVIDPIGSVPIFVALTNKMDKVQRKKTSELAIVTAASLLIIFAIGGTQILSIFGVKIESFMIAGGILLFILSMELLTHGGWRFGIGDSSEDTGVVPFAFPLLVGPGAITSVIISFETAGLLVTIVSIAIVIGVTYLTLLLIDPINKILGRRGSIVITRVFAILVAAIGIQYVIDGLMNITSQ
ncbi:MAG TPA: MarC family protein [Nitrososphaeraceae archaeon]